MKVLASGSFDLVHAGHIRYLKESAKLGSELHVSIAGDAYIRNKKGDGYPIYPYPQRAEIISNLKFVTKTYEAPAATPALFRLDVERLLRIIKPDIVTGGWEGTGEHWARPLARKFGYLFVRLDCEVTHTTDIVTKILELNNR